MLTEPDRQAAEAIARGTETPMKLDRFRPPTRNDELADCQGCGKTLDYRALNKHGLCWECGGGPKELETEDENENN